MNCLKNLARALFVLLTAMAANSAWATDYTYNLGAWNPSMPYTQLVQHTLPGEPVGTAFTDFFNFQIASGTGASGVAVNLYLDPFLNIDFLQLGLYSGQNGLGSLLDGPVGSGVTLTANLLTNTDYSLKITGITSGSSGGAYSTAIAAVPEADTWAMMLVGLGMLGVVLLRKRKLFTTPISHEAGGC